MNTNKGVNPIAERVNGIIKNEYLTRYNYKTTEELEEKLNEVVHLYNNKRPHSSCDMLTPGKVHKHNLPVKRKWKTNYRPRIPASVP